MQKIQLQEFQVARVAFGAMNMCHPIYYQHKTMLSEAECKQLIYASLDQGYDFYDTAAVYGARQNEKLLGKYLSPYYQDLLVATKCGLELLDGKNTIDGTGEVIQASCEASLKNLKTDCIDLLYLHRTDPKVPVEDSVGAMSRLVEQGKVKHLGLSEVGVDTLKRAHKIHPITAVQSEYSLWTRLPELKMLDACTEMGIVFLGFSSVGRAFLSGKFREKQQQELDKRDIRASMPRFNDLENFAKNLQLLKPLEQIALKHNCSMAQVAIAWTICQYDCVISLPGSSQIQHTEENFNAQNIRLEAEDIKLLEANFAEQNIHGNRYNKAMMAGADSEKDRL